MIKLSDDTEPIHSQSNYVTKKITPKFLEEKFSHFIQATMANGWQGGKGEGVSNRKGGEIPQTQ